MLALLPYHRAHENDLPRSAFDLRWSIDRPEATHFST